MYVRKYSIVYVCVCVCTICFFFLCVRCKYTHTHGLANLVYLLLIRTAEQLKITLSLSSMLPYISLSYIYIFLLFFLLHISRSCCYFIVLVAVCLLRYCESSNRILALCRCEATKSNGVEFCAENNTTMRTHSFVWWPTSYCVCWMFCLLSVLLLQYCSQNVTCACSFRVHSYNLLA